MSTPQSPALMVALPLQGRLVVVLGDGHEAADKALKFLHCGARVRVVCAELPPELALEVRRGRLSWYARAWDDFDLKGAHMVVLAVVDPDQVLRVRAAKARQGFILAAVDQPAASDLFFVSTVTRGPVQLGVSTGGRAPLLARLIRRALERGLGEEFGKFATTVATLRTQLRSLPKAQRILRIEQALNGFAIKVAVSYPDQTHPPRDQAGENPT